MFSTFIASGKCYALILSLQLNKPFNRRILTFLFYVLFFGFIVSQSHYITETVLESYARTDFFLYLICNQDLSYSIFFVVTNFFVKYGLGLIQDSTIDFMYT